jgi:hypothetical protein
VFLSDEFTFEDYLHIEDKLLHHLNFRIQVPFDLSYIEILKKFFLFGDQNHHSLVVLIKKGLALNILRRFDIKEIIFGFIFNLDRDIPNEKKLLATELFSVQVNNCKENFAKLCTEMNSFHSILNLKKFDLDINFIN